MNLPWTICFIRHGDNVLVQYRKNPPNGAKWNGVGGKINPGETPFQCVLREVKEETGCTLLTARFAGIVTWSGAPETGFSGMYAYVADFPADDDPHGIYDWHDEGPLEWLPLEHLYEESELVSNIPHFLPYMLGGWPPLEYHCKYLDDGELVSVQRRPLPHGFSMDGVAA